jgi:endoglucanase
MTLDLLAHLRELCLAPGLSGYENPVRDLLRQAWSPLTDELKTDALGSLWATQSGTGKQPRPRLMLAAHMDAIGLMVTQVVGEFLRVTEIGGIDARVMPGQLVTVHAAGGDLPGVVAQPPSFLLPKANREGVVPLSELLVDTGLPADEVRRQVRIGDLISFAQPPRELQNGSFSAKSLDNRASVAALSVCLEVLREREHTWDVVAVATVQEEEGLTGARTAAFALHPDVAIAVDVTFGDGPNVKEFAHRTNKLGGGPVIGLGPNIHPALQAALCRTAERLEMPFETEVMPSHSGTDAFAIQIAREGIPTALVSIPLRNMHTPVEMVALKDVSRAGRLLAEFAVELTPDYLSRLTLD